MFLYSMKRTGMDKYLRMVRLGTQRALSVWSLQSGCTKCKALSSIESVVGSFKVPTKTALIERVETEPSKSFIIGR